MRYTLIGPESVLLDGVVDAAFGGESDLLVEPHGPDEAHVDARHGLEEDRLDAPEAVRRAHEVVHKQTQLLRHVLRRRPKHWTLATRVHLLQFNSHTNVIVPTSAFRAHILIHTQYSYIPCNYEEYNYCLNYSILLATHEKYADRMRQQRQPERPEKVVAAVVRVAGCEVAEDGHEVGQTVLDDSAQ